MNWWQPSKRNWACKPVPIVINSKSCSNAGWWAAHLQKTETNERVEIIGFYEQSPLPAWLPERLDALPETEALRRRRQVSTVCA